MISSAELSTSPVTERKEKYARQCSVFDCVECPGKIVSIVLEKNLIRLINDDPESFCFENIRRYQENGTK